LPQVTKLRVNIDLENPGREFYDPEI